MESNIITSLTEQKQHSRVFKFFAEAANAVNFATRRPLEVGDIIVMDNLGVHHCGGGEALEEFLADMGI